MTNLATNWGFNQLACLALISFLLVLLVFQPLALLGATLALLLFLATLLRPDWILYLILVTLPLQGTLVITYRANIKTSELLGCVLVLSLAFRFLIWRESFHCDRRITVPLIFFISMVLLSTINTPRLRESMVLNQYMELGVGRDSPDARSYITALWSVYCALLLISVPTVLQNVDRLYSAFKALIWSGAAAAVFGIVQWVQLLRTGQLYELPGSIYHLDVVHSSSQGFPRSPSTFTEPSLFASYLVLLLPISLALAVGSYPRIVGRKLAYVFVVLEIIALLLSFSVSGFVLFLIALSFFTYLATARISRGAVGVIARRVAICAIALLLVVSVLQAVGVYPADVGEFVAERLLGQADSAQQRFGLAQIGWEMAKDHFITGVGIGNFPFLAMTYGAEHSIVLMQFVFPTPSNLYILFLAELGVPGVAVLLWLVHGTYRFFANALYEISPEFQLLHCGMCASLAGVLLTFVFLDNLFVNYLWIVLGMGVALYRVTRTPQTTLET
jgi:hypothetical protein